MNMRNRNRGSSTVFLCLMSGVMLIFIISLIGIMQYRWEETQLVRCANIAVRSEFGKYYRPLYDTYRMFYYVNDVPERYDAGVTGYFLDNQKNMPDYLKLSLSYVDVTDKLYAVNEGGNNVRKQMSNGVKYLLGEKAYEEAAKRFRKNENEKNENVNEELEQALGELDEISENAVLESKVLELLRIVEGISICDGNITCHPGFVKEGIKGDITPANAGVDSDKVWEKTESEYWTLDSLPEKIKKKAEAGIKGKKINVPTGELKEWGNKLNNLIDTTEKAYELAKNINSSLSGGGNVEAICDVALFEDLLGANITVLKEAVKLAEASKQFDDREYKIWLEKSRETIEALKDYHVKELIFDYSTLTLAKVKDPRKNAGKSVSGILGMLIDDQKSVSKKVIAESDMYAELMKEEETGIHNMEYDFDNDVEDLQEFLGDCKDNTESKWNDIGVRLYINSFFDNYVKKNTGVIKQPEKKALDYELEYIVAGRETDEQNLRAVVNMIMMQRTGVSFVRLMSDSVNSNKAYAAAAAIVGFTGIDALVRCVQLAIMAAWAYEDACVDMAVLLDGGKIPLIKNSINIAFEEMLMFGKELIQRKVAGAKSKSGIDYSDILNTLLLTKGINLITCRSMDIIQNNIKLNYSKRFSFQNCIYSATTRIGCIKPYECSTGVVFEYE